MGVCQFMKKDESIPVKESELKQIEEAEKISELKDDGPLQAEQVWALQEAYLKALRIVQRGNKDIYVKRKKKAKNRMRNKMAKASRRRNR